MAKNDLKMLANSSKKSLVVVRGDAVDQHGNKLVLIANYSKEGKYGYFICEETVDDLPDATLYHYSKPVAFYENTGKDSYSKAVAAYGDIVVLYRLT